MPDVPDDSREFNPYGGSVFGDPETPPTPQPPPPSAPPPAGPWGAPPAAPAADPYGGYGAPPPANPLEDSRFGVQAASPHAAQALVAEDLGGEIGTIRFDGVGRLAEAFGPVFALILQLRTTSPVGEPDALRQQTLRLLRESAAAALQTGAPPDDVDQATFALVAFFDEAVLLSEWPGRQAWMARPLQLELYDRYDAGERFYDRLNTLLDDPSRTEALEVYYLAMALGFKGQYQIRGQDELRRLVARAQEKLAKAPGLVPGPLAPHGIPETRAEVEDVRSIPGWLVFVGALLVVALVYAGFSVYNSSVAGDVAAALRELAVRR